MKKLFVVLALLASICHGQTIEFVVKSSPGGPDDTITRKIVEHLEKTTSLDFVVMNYEFSGDTKIPHDIYCIVNNKKILFKLEFAVLILYLDNKNINHVINGLICNGDYFIYDSATNNYFHFDWTNLNNDNLSNVLNFYNIYYSKFINVDMNVKNTSNKFFLLYDETKRLNFKLKYAFAVYYNTELDFTYNPKICNRTRK